MATELRKAVDDDGNPVEITKVSETQGVQTVDRTIEFKIKPRWYGPDGLQLTADGEGAFRNALGTRYRLTD